jgi:hypothetical protein
MEEISEDQDSREWLRSYQLLLWYSWSALSRCSSLHQEIQMFNPIFAQRFVLNCSV